MWKALDDDLPQLHTLGSDLATRLAGTDDPAQQDNRLHTMSETDAVEGRDCAPSHDAALLQACEDFGAAVYNYVSGATSARRGDAGFGQG